MRHEHLALEDSRRGHGTEPGHVLRPQSLDRKAVGFPHLLRLELDKLPVMVAADRGKIERHKDVGGRRRLERSRHVIAKVQRRVGILLLDVGKHRF
jgi:hypothetical protein